MSKISLKKNFIMNSILTMSSIVFPLISFPYVSRILLPIGMGKIAFVTAFISYFVLFANLGIPTYGIRICAQVRDDKKELTRVVHELLIISAFMNLIVYTALCIVVYFTPKLQAEIPLVTVMSLNIILSSVGIEWLYKALEKYSYITIRSIFFKFIALGLMLAFVHTKEDYIIYGAITIFATSASSLLNIINAHHYILFKPIGKYNILRHMKPILIFFAMACATTIYTHLDTVMLGFMTTDQDVGYYDAAIKIKNILVSLVTSLGAVLLPRAAYIIEKGRMEEFWKISKKAVSFVFVFAIPVATYFILYADYSILFLAGDSFKDSIQPMQILMPTLLIIGLTNILGMQILVPTGRELIVLLSVSVGAVVDVSINLALIPVLESSGAAIGTLIAEVAVLIIQFVALKLDVNHIFPFIRFGTILLGTIIAGIVSYIVTLFSFGYFITLVLTSIIFFGLYTVVLLLKKEETAVEIFLQIKRFSKRKI